MRIKTFTVPFSEIVGAEATELDFDPGTDFLVLRSIFAEPTSEVREFAERITSMSADTPQEEADALVLDLLTRCVVDWHLVGPDGKPVGKPGSADDLNALPGALRGALFPYLASFRGRPDPTPAA